MSHLCQVNLTFIHFQSKSQQFILLRESLFLNGILYSSEAWYGLKKTEIDDLEKLDKILLRRIFEVPQSVPSASLFLESGCIRIGTMIKARRVNFLHYLVNLDESEMLYKFFISQWDQGTELDWTEQVRLDLKDLNLPISLKFIKSKSKFSFKRMVKENMKNYEFKKLMDEKSSKSKMKNLYYTELKMQDYLKLTTMTKSQAIVVFKFRLRMSPFGENFRAGQQSKICPFCSLHVDSQEESFRCAKMNQLMEIKGKFSDVFGENLSTELVQTLSNMYYFRDEYRKLSE